MKRFSTLMSEVKSMRSGYPAWVKATAGLLANNVRSDANAVHQAKGVEQKMDLIADQNTRLAYILALVVGVNKGRLKK